MMGKARGVVSGVLAFALWITVGASFGAEGIGKPEAEGGKPPVVGGVRLLPDGKGLEIEGRVCLAEGILDFVAVIEKGREYESVLALKCKPSALHAALLAMGAKPGPTPAFLRWRKKREDEAPPKRVGSKLLITVEWKDEDGKTRHVPAQSLLFNRKTKKVEPTSNPWIFTGSYFGKNLDGKQVYVADIDGAVISVVSDGGAVINLAEDAGNPYDDAEQGFVVNTKVVPKVGTPVKVTIRPAPASEPE